MSCKELLSDRSISSENESTQTHEARSAGNSTEPSEFVNHGLHLWNQDRQKWKSEKEAVRRPKKLRLPKLRNLSLSITKGFCCGGRTAHDKMLRDNKPFPKTIPLSEMADFLVDIWEQEGLYD